MLYAKNVKIKESEKLYFKKYPYSVEIKQIKEPKSSSLPYARYLYKIFKDKQGLARSSWPNFSFHQFCLKNKDNLRVNYNNTIFFFRNETQAQQFINKISRSKSYKIVLIRQPKNNQILEEMKNSPKILFRKSLFYKKYQYRITFEPMYRFLRKTDQRKTLFDMLETQFSSLPNSEYHKYGNSLYYWVSFRDRDRLDDTDFMWNVYNNTILENRYSNMILFLKEDEQFSYVNLLLSEYITKVDKIHLTNKETNGDTNRVDREFN